MHVSIFIVNDKREVLFSRALERSSMQIQPFLNNAVNFKSDD